MYPGTIAQYDPHRPALVMGRSGLVVTYGELNSGSIKFSRLLRESGLRPGDHFAIMAENHPLYYEVVWAALRSGYYVTAINSHLTPTEAAYIVNDCEAKVFVTSAALAETALALVELMPGLRQRLMFDGEVAGYESYERATSAFPGSQLGDEHRGTVMLYSSGTTGRPKGVKFPLPAGDASLGEGEIAQSSRALYGFREDMVYLSPAPLYHSAPLRVSLAVQSLGGKVVVMERFDPEQALMLIERERVTHSQWVPTMFIRMLKLPADRRDRWDLSSHEIAVHAAAPCPIEVKEQMIRWWGPILVEYYAGTENIGSTTVTSSEWLEHKGSVGRPSFGAVIHVCDDSGAEVPTNETGTIYFEQPGSSFEYQNDSAKTAGISHPDHPGWRTLGDIGRLDEDGYLYLTDRKAFMIVSGGVNIYPQEIEEVLLAHPVVLDAAVIGVPNPDMGEEVKAVVQLVPSEGGDTELHQHTGHQMAGYQKDGHQVSREDAGGSELRAVEDVEAELRSWCAQRLASYKVPRSFDFVESLPRLDNGKLYKRLLRDPYWEGRRSRIV